MTPIADMVREMIERQTSAELIVLAVSTAERAMLAAGRSGGIPLDAAAERQRGYDRESSESPPQYGASGHREAY